MQQLSFDFDTKFIFSHKNDFGTKDKVIDYLFSVDIFLFWVYTENGKVLDLSGTRTEELKSWSENAVDEDEDNPYIISNEAFAIHEKDVEILNSKKYLKKIQILVDRNK